MGDRYQVISESGSSKVVDMRERRVVATFTGKDMAKSAATVASRMNEGHATERIREVEYTDE